jgi:hypothetical protein
MMRKYKRKGDMFKIEPQITTLMKDYEGKPDKQRKIIAKHNGDLFFIFKPTEEQSNEQNMGKS